MTSGRLVTRCFSIRIDLVGIVTGGGGLQARAINVFKHIRHKVNGPVQNERFESEAEVGQNFFCL